MAANYYRILMRIISQISRFHLFMIIIHLEIFLKLFFIGYARGWCEAKTLGDLVGQLQGDPHPPAMVRVLLTLKNNEDFKQAFQCQAGDRMISENPCRVW